MFKGINAAACFFQNGVYDFHRENAAEVISSLNDMSDGSVTCAIFNPQTRKLVDETLPNKTVSGNVVLSENDHLFSFSYDGNPQTGYTLGNIFRISMVSREPEVSQTFQYVWSNRMMNSQMSGKYSLVNVEPTREQVQAILSQNIFLRHQSTLDEFSKFSGHDSLEIARTDFGPLMVGETALIVLPKTQGPVIAGVDLQNVELQYFAVTRLE